MKFYYFFKAFIYFIFHRLLLASPPEFTLQPTAGTTQVFPDISQALSSASDSGGTILVALSSEQNISPFLLEYQEHEIKKDLLIKPAATSSSPPTLYMKDSQIRISPGASLKFERVNIVFLQDEGKVTGESFFRSAGGQTIHFQSCALQGNLVNRALIQGDLNTLILEDSGLSAISFSAASALTLIDIACNSFQLLRANFRDSRLTNTSLISISMKIGSSSINQLQDVSFANISSLRSSDPLIEVVGSGMGGFSCSSCNMTDVKGEKSKILSVSGFETASFESFYLASVISPSDIIFIETVGRVAFAKSIFNASEGAMLVINNVAKGVLIEETVVRKCLSYNKACLIFTSELDGLTTDGLTIKNCNFEQNKAVLLAESSSAQQAGAIYISLDYLTSVNSSNFSENQLSNIIMHPSGASLSFESDVGSLLISDCVFKKNKALYHTPGLLVVSLHFIVLSTDFEGNEPLTAVLSQTHDSNTGPINFDSYDFRMYDTNFFKNKGYTGSIVFFFTDKFKETRVYDIQNVRASENLCYQGGFFFDASIGDLFITINIRASEFINNFAEGFGSAMRTSFNSIYVKIFYVSCKFLNNTSVKFGGAIALKTTSGTVHWSYSEFTNNTALNGKGGAIFGSCLSYTLIQTYKCLFSNNRGLMARHIYIIIGNYSDQFSTYVTGFDSVQSQFAFGSRGYFEYSTFYNVNRSSTGTFFEVLQGSDVRIYHCRFENITTSNNLVSGIMFGSLRVDNSTLKNIRISQGRLLFLTKIRFLDVKNFKISNISVREGMISVAATNLNLATFTNITVSDVEGPFLTCQDSTVLVVTNVSLSNLKSDSKLLGTLLDLRSSSILNISLFRVVNVVADVREMIRSADSSLFMRNSSMTNFSSKFVDLLLGVYSAVRFLSCEFRLFVDYLMDLSQVELSLESVVLVSKGDKSLIKASGLGGIYAVDNPKTVFSNCTFRNFTSKLGAVLNLIGDQFRSVLNISNSLFIGNYAENEGGVLKLTNVESSIRSCNFTENEAAVGGVIWNSCKLGKTTCMLNLARNRFLNNRASNQGGVLFWFDKQPVVDNLSHFEGNSAFYGDNNASFPIRMKSYEKLTNEPELENASLHEEVSGSVITRKLLFKLIDPYDQEARLVENPFIRGFAIAQIYEGQRGSSKLAKLRASNINRSALIGDLQVPVVKGEINFDYLKIIGDPDSYISLRIDIGLDYIPTYLKSLREDEIIENGKYYLFFDIFLRNCIRGEVYNSITNTCDKCPQDTFSLKVPGELCEHCPERGVCPGGDIIRLESEGLWRANSSSKIYECRLKKNQCQGGELSLCAEGYSGILCDTCTHGYRLSNFDCKDCSEWGIGIVVIIGFFLFYIIVIAASVRKKNSLENTKDNPIFKIFISYVQTIALVKFFEIDIGLGSLSKTFKGISNSIFGSFQYPGLLFDLGFSISGVDCIFSYSSVYENHFYKVLFSDFVPLFFCIGSVVVLALFSLRRIHKDKRLQYFKQNVIVTFVIIFFLFQPSIVQNGLQIMNCSKIDSTLYLDMNYEVECWTGQHLFWSLSTVFPFLILATLVIPAFLFFLLKAVLNPEVDIREMTKSRYGFILSGYRDDKFFWELLIMIRKFLLQTAVILLYNFNMKLCLFMAFLLLLVFLYLQIRYKPFLWEDINNLELKGLFSMAMLTFIYLYSQFKNTGLEVIIFMVIAVLLNIVYCYGFIKYFLAIIVERFKEYKKAFLRYKVRSSQFISRLSITKKLAFELNKRASLSPKKKKSSASSARMSKEALDENFQAKPNSFSSRLSSFEKVTHDAIDKENIFSKKDSRKQSPAHKNNSPSSKNSKDGQKVVIGRDSLFSRNSSNNNLISKEPKSKTLNFPSEGALLEAKNQEPETDPKSRTQRQHSKDGKNESEDEVRQMVTNRKQAQAEDQFYTHKQNPNVEAGKKKGDESVREMDG